MGAPPVARAARLIPAEGGAESGQAAPRAGALVVAWVGVTVGVATGAVPAWPGVVHLVALPPLDLAADLRLVMTEATSPGVAALYTSAAVVGRAVLLGAYLGSVRRNFWFALRFYVLALPVVGVAAVLDFAARAALYAWFFWAGLVVLVAVVAVLGGVPWDGHRRIWPAWPGWRRRARGVPLLGAYVAALAVLGAVAPRGGGALAAVPVSAVLTWWVARRLAEPRRRSLRLAAVVAVGAAVVSLAALVVPVGDSSGPPSSRRSGSLLLVPGVATASGRGALFRLDPGDLGYSCAQTYYFSYAGPGAGAARGGARCPIRTGAPYSGRDTRRPLAELASGFVDQVAALPPPVVVVTHSQGAWIAWAALAATDRLPVDAVVMLGPFAHTLAPYPPPGARGPGYAGGVALRGLVGLARALEVTSFDPDAPLTRELQATAGAIDAVLARPLPPRVTAVVVESRWDLPVGPAAWPEHVVLACPVAATHTGLATSPAAMRAVRDRLDHPGGGRCPGWVNGIARAAEAFGVPTAANR